MWHYECVFLSVRSEFSEVVHIMTSCSVPAPPLNPELVQSGVTWLCIRWQRPAGSPKEDDIGYVLEMEEQGSVSPYTHLHRHSQIYNLKPNEYIIGISVDIYQSYICRHIFFMYRPTYIGWHIYTSCLTYLYTLVYIYWSIYIGLRMTCIYLSTYIGHVSANIYRVTSLYIGWHLYTLVDIYLSTYINHISLQHILVEVSIYIDWHIYIHQLTCIDQHILVIYLLTNIGQHV